MQNGPHSGPRRGAAAPLAAGLSHVAPETPWLCAPPSPAVRPLQRIESPAYSPRQDAAVMGITRGGAKLASGRCQLRRLDGPRAPCTARREWTPRLRAANGIKLVCDFEGQVEWVVG